MGCGVTALSRDSGEARMAEPTNEFELLMQRVRSGCPKAAQELFDLYGAKVSIMVRRVLDRRLRRRYDSDDFAQSVWLSFFRTAPGKYTFTTPQALIAFLSRIAYHKVLDTNRRQLETQKQALGREVRLEPGPRGSAEGLDRLPARVPTPSQVAMAAERWENMLAGQPPEYQQAMDLLRQGHSQVEVAARLGMNPRLLQRILERLRRKE
jgi:RNA polymerase sigma factor (sigma-70 family)